MIGYQRRCSGTYHKKLRIMYMYYINIQEYVLLQICYSRKVGHTIKADYIYIL